ncbi:MAG: YciI family protein [Methylophilaceae bacterium]|nr:YciI family protein [Methylophilaceae bacterium]
MWYVFNAKDKKGSLDKRLQYRPLHLARLELLISEGRLLIAGAYPAIDNIEPGAAGFQGSLIIADFDDMEAAQKWADDEPFLTHGIYESIDIKPFRKSIP